MKTRKALFEKDKDKILANIYEDLLFHGLPSEARKLVGEEAAKILITRPIISAMKRAIELQHIPKSIIDSPDMASKFNFCYDLMAWFGFPFEHEVVEETEELYVEKVTRCPHIKNTKKDPLACAGCYGMKIGILEPIMGKKPEMRAVKRMAVGDPYCLFEVEKL